MMSSMQFLNRHHIVTQKVTLTKQTNYISKYSIIIIEKSNVIAYDNGGIVSTQIRTATAKRNKIAV